MTIELKEIYSTADIFQNPRFAGRTTAAKLLYFGLHATADDDGVVVATSDELREALPAIRDCIDSLGELEKSGLVDVAKVWDGKWALTIQITKWDGTRLVQA